MSNTDTVGWVITSTEKSSRQRIGYGQGMEDADATQQSFDAVIGRTIYMAFNLKASQIPADKQVRWRAYSDDGDFAYAGVVHWDWLMGISDPDGAIEDDDLAYNIDRFCMEDWGATIVLYNGDDILRGTPDDRRNLLTEWIERQSAHRFAPTKKEKWIAIYG